MRRRKFAEPTPEFIGPVQPIWMRGKFPSCDITASPFPGTRHTLKKPFCWTPTKPFGRFVWGYPCISFETTNFGFIIQKGPHGLTIEKY